MAYDRDLAERIREIMAPVPGAREKAMFGGLAFLVGGHMAVAASGQGGLLARVDPADTAQLSKEDGVEPMVMRGRSMSGWLRVDAVTVAHDRALQEWIERGLSYVRTLPPKSAR